MQRLDRGVIDAIAAAFAGSGKVFVSTSAGPVYGDTAGMPRDEHEPIENPHPLRAWRVQHDRDVVALVDRGTRGVVLRPGLIYGRAGGWVAGLIRRAQQTRRARYIGEGTHRTSTVHVDALADLYLRAVTNESAAGIYNAGSDEVHRPADTAQLIAATFGPGIEAESWPVDEARVELGDLADLSTVECIISSNRARCELGWHPIAPSLTTEIASGSYRTSPLVHLPYGTS
jgi:nucleoside-diphosphate-sugar epimerase